MAEASDDLLRFLRHEEGLRLTAYLDVAGIPTIGYGATRYADGRKVELGDRITRADADALFATQVAHYVAGVERLITADLTGGQLDALTSFAYNVGLAALERSGLRRAVNADPLSRDVDREWVRWCYAGGKVRSALLNRRKRELRWFRE
jgi:lysozyme